MPLSLSHWCAALLLAAGVRAWLITYVHVDPRPAYFVLDPRFLNGDQGDEMLIERFHIDAINRAAFAGKPLLKTIRIRDSQIINIDKGAFAESPTVKEILITNSSVNSAQLTPDVFEADCCPNLIGLTLSGYDMNAAHIDFLKYIRLQKLLLANCSLRAIPAFATRNYSRTIVELDFSSNQLPNLDYPKEFYYMENLKNLLFSDNNIEYIQEDIFKPLKKITTINLNSNRMSRFSEKLFQDLSTLEVIDLSSNRIEHVSVDAFRGTKLRSLDLSGNRLTYLPGGFCGRAGAALKAVYCDGNPWQCACLNDFLVEAKRLNIQYRKESSEGRYSGRTPLCVTSSRFLCLRPSEYYQVYDNFMRNR